MVGNHEMWTVRRKSRAGGDGEGELEGISSVDKLVQLHRMCEVGGRPLKEKRVCVSRCARVAALFVEMHAADDLRSRCTGPIKGRAPLQFRAPVWLLFFAVKVCTRGTWMVVC